MSDVKCGKNQYSKLILVAVLFAILLAGAVFMAAYDFYAVKAIDLSEYAGKVSLTQEDGEAVVRNKFYQFAYDLEKNTYSFRSERLKVFEGAYSEAVFDGKNEAKSTDYPKGKYSVTEISDEFGKGIRLSITLEKSGGGVNMLQAFSFYQDVPYMFTDVTLLADQPASQTQTVSSAYLSPFTVEKKTGAFLMGSASDLTYLKVPFDNDEYVKYETVRLRGLNKTAFSSEVSVIYNNSGNTFLLGSIDHDTYKNGIEADITFSDNLKALRLYSGAANSATHDVVKGKHSLSHGAVTGQTVSSARMMLGVFDSYMTALDTYGEVNAVVTPPLIHSEGAPFGWSAWAAHGKDVGYTEYTAASDYFAENLSGFNNDGITYINFDSFWEWMSEDELKGVLKTIKDNGQRAGVYFTPFALFDDKHYGLDVDVPGTNGAYKFKDIVLRDDSGKILHHTGKSLDLTHPGTRMYIESQCAWFAELGFSYIKMDFLTAGALEGEFYDKSITTGMQAYNYGVNYLKNALSKEVCGTEFFVSLAISPLFPSGYAHARRICCDVFGDMGATNYLLNALTYAWWQQGTLYQYNDPDHIVIYKAYYESKGISEREAQACFNARIIGGTVLLSGENTLDKNAQERMQQYYTNEDLLSVAKIGKAFRPIGFANGIDGTDVFYLQEGGNVYIALFAGNKTHTVSVDLSDITGIKSKYTAKNLNNGESEKIGNTLSVRLKKGSSVIYELTPQ